VPIESGSDKSDPYKKIHLNSLKDGVKILFVASMIPVKPYNGKGLESGGELKKTSVSKSICSKGFRVL
jgi:hypothetical protein